MENQCSHFNNVTLDLRSDFMGCCTQRQVNIKLILKQTLTVTTANSLVWKSNNWKHFCLLEIDSKNTTNILDKNATH